MDATRDLPGWPNSDCSSLITLRPHRWHVQQKGGGPTLLLLHGAGGSTHSFRDLLPGLAQDHHVVAVDLPGHGFSMLGTRHRSSLNAMAQDLAALCTDQGWQTTAIIGHSAGAAVALRLSQLLPGTPSVIGINPALEPFRGLAGIAFPIFARIIAMTPFVVDFALRSLARPGRVAALLENTGSKIDAEGCALYARLFRDKAHVDGVLLMMAQWKLDGLLADLPQLNTQCLFLTGSRDRTVPPVIAVEAADMMPNCEAQSLEDYGHLMHEEAPERIATLVRNWLT
ncbi:alpha/beta fold hydrolase BchO [Thalassococcus sp. BH17M4-6]|uniref:alpha/beta fold hydrolase BchO n=1 Tax=Thalassococcus sp. BH17M4-6 TaxID=3413148 RepID=UPI003BE5517B